MRVILPVGPSLGVDTIVCAVGPALADKLGQAIVIENLQDTGGITGTSALVKAAPDGNTITFNNRAVNPSVYKKMPYDGLADATPISIVGATPFVLVVNPTRLPAKNAKELAALLNARLGTYNPASSGNRTIIDAKQIPYKGVGPMLADLIGGQVDFGVVAVPAVQGRMRHRRPRRTSRRRDRKAARCAPSGALARAACRRCPICRRSPSRAIPTSTSPAGFAVIAPKGLPAAEVKRLHDAVTAAFADPEVRTPMARQENIIAPTTPETAQMLKSEPELYARLVRKSNISLD